MNNNSSSNNSTNQIIINNNNNNKLIGPFHARSPKLWKVPNSTPICPNKSEELNNESIILVRSISDLKPHIPWPHLKIMHAASHSKLPASPIYVQVSEGSWTVYLSSLNFVEKIPNIF